MVPAATGCGRCRDRCRQRTACEQRVSPCARRGRAPRIFRARDRADRLVPDPPLEPAARARRTLAARAGRRSGANRRRPGIPGGGGGTRLPRRRPGCAEPCRGTAREEEARILVARPRHRQERGSLQRERVQITEGPVPASVLPMKTGLSIPAILLVIAMPSLARAQSQVQAGAWTVSPLLGVAFDPDGDASLALAGAVDYHVTSAFALEGELGHVFDTAPDNPDVDASLTTAHASVLYIFDVALRPYVAAGIGAGHYSVEVRAPQATFETTEIG